MRNFLLFLLCIVIGVGTVPARALEVAPTPDSEFVATAPVLITGYQTAEAAQNVVAVEVYNSSDIPVNLSEWALFAVLKDASSQLISAASQYNGWFLPGEHVVYSPSDSTTFQIALHKQMSAIASIEARYVGSGLGYRAAIAPIRDLTDVPFFRTYTTTGYSAAAQPFAATPLREFYDDGLYQPLTTPGDIRIVEIYPYGIDCAPNDESVLCGDYIKLLNTGTKPIDLDHLVLRTDSSSASRTSANTFVLGGQLGGGEYITISRTDAGARISLTNSGGYVWLEDAWDMARYDNTITRYESASVDEQGYAYALSHDSQWAWTTTPQPASGNVISLPVVVVAECSEGKYRNPDTGRCRTIEEAVNALSTCEEGYERNPVTNRCRKIATLSSATLTPCLEGQERNPTTNRCRSIASAVAELLPCEEGYERNPDTHRCRKVTDSTMPVADFPVAPVKLAASDTAGWWAFGIVLAMAVGYGVWEWRLELGTLTRRALGIFTRTK